MRASPATSIARAGAVATVAHFALAANGSGRVSFTLSVRALHRLFANVPDGGHDLVTIRLSVTGPAGQRSAGAAVYAVDAPPSVRPRHHRTPVVPPGYRAPVDPWVIAHAAC